MRAVLIALLAVSLHAGPMAAQDTRTVQVRVWSPSKLPLSGGRLVVTDPKGEAVTVRPDARGYGELAVTGDGPRRVVWVQDDLRRELGTFRLDRSLRSAVELEVALSVVEGRTVGYLALRPRTPARSPAREATPTGVALEAAPERVARDATVAGLREGLKAAPAASDDGDRERAPAPAPAAPPEARSLDRASAAIFDTGGLDARSSDPAVRRVWRMISNAYSADDHAEAQAALADLLEAAGEDARAEMARRRAAWWRGRS